ncbi:MAG: hypothetical protein L0Y75_07385 [Acidobacteria bacterium]|nr:hypothetical protein [Acidobacteriota bacterium]
MPETIKLELTETEAKSLRELIVECVNKMKQAHDQMAKDQIEIERLGSEIREILSRNWKAA